MSEMRAEMAKRRDPVGLLFSKAPWVSVKCLLGKEDDPLLAAKEVLRRPGPFAEVTPNER